MLVNANYAKAGVLLVKPCQRCKFDASLWPKPVHCANLLISTRSKSISYPDIDFGRALRQIGIMEHHDPNKWYGTTIIGVKKDGKTIIAGDGQVSLGQTVIKSSARKVRRLKPGGHEVIAGFAGSTADAFTLLERLEAKLEASPGQLLRAAVELAKDWRTDKYLRNLEAMMIVADREDFLVLTGSGDVLEPENGIAAIGSGGMYALAAARGMEPYEEDAEKIARRALELAGEICVYTNGNLTVEAIE